MLMVVACKVNKKFGIRHMNGLIFNRVITLLLRAATGLTTK